MKILIKLSFLSLLMISLSACIPPTSKNQDKKTKISQLDKEEINSSIKYTVREINKKVPIRVSEDVQHSFSLALDRELKHVYNYVNHIKENLDTSESIIENRKKKFINSYCTTKDLQIFVANNVSISYDFYDREDKHIFSVKVNSSDCIKNKS